MALPLISIITVTYNAEHYLERTIKSVITQTYPHIEYLIIDGGSKDGTLDIIKRYSSSGITKWVSEPDKGLYDAMNKGLAMATGEYIWFMNAGDEIYTPNTLDKIIAKGRADVYYGETLFVTDTEEVGLRSQVTPHKLPKKLNWQGMRLGMVVCHQSFIARKAIVPPYDLSFRYSADVDWEIKCLKKANTIVYVEEIISRYLMGGLTHKNLIKSLTERYKVLQNHFGLFGAIKSHFLIGLRGIAFAWKRKSRYW